MKQYLNYIKDILSQLQEIGYCSDAKLLNENIGEDYFDITNPHFYTGDFESDLVMVQLNAKRTKKDFGKNLTYSYDEYINHYSNYGKIIYGIESRRVWKSAFDLKQIRFLKPLEILPFTNSNIFDDLEIVADKKLQLELVPFGSPDFNYQKVGAINLNAYIDRLLELIVSKDRKCVVFCGRVFHDILKPFVVSEKIHCFKLLKINNEFTQNDYQLIEIQLEYKGKKLNAFIAPQYAKHGIPLSEYGKKLRELIKS